MADERDKRQQMGVQLRWIGISSIRRANRVISEAIEKRGLYRSIVYIGLYIIEEIMSIIYRWSQFLYNRPINSQ